MKIYKIERDSYDYDEYIGFVIVANNRKETKELAIKVGLDGNHEQDVDMWAAAKIKLISEYTGKRIKSFVIMESFNSAG